MYKLYCLSCWPLNLFHKPHIIYSVAKPVTILKEKTLYSSRLQIQSISALFLYVLQGLARVLSYNSHVPGTAIHSFIFELATSSMYMRGYVIPFDLDAYLGT